MEKTYCEKLNEWFQKEKRDNGLVDIKFFPLLPEEIPDSQEGKEALIEALAKSVYETVTGQIPSYPLDVTNL